IVGRLLGERALTLLRDTKPSETVLQVPVRDYTLLAFDDRQLARWRIPESRLPPRSVVLYRPHTLWKHYRPQGLATIIVAGLTAALLGVILVERHRRHRAELQAHKHLVVAAHLDRRAAMGALATSLAHELNQPLNAILQNAGVAEMLLTSDGRQQ